MPDPNSSDAERLARDLGNDAFSRNVKSQRPPIADLMSETAELEKSGAFMSGEDAVFTEERGPQPPFNPHDRLPGEYEIGRLIREAVDMDGANERFYLTCSVGELAQRISRHLAK